MEDRLFDFEEIFYLFKKKFWIIIVVTAITTSLAVVKVSKLQPSYSATAKIFMGNGNDMLQVYSESELSYYSQFITIFSEISKIDGFLDDTLKEHKIDKTSLEVASALSFSASANTPIVNIFYQKSLINNSSPGFLFYIYHTHLFYLYFYKLYPLQKFLQAFPYLFVPYWI